MLALPRASFAGDAADRIEVATGRRPGLAPGQRLHFPEQTPRGGPLATQFVFESALAFGDLALGARQLRLRFASGRVRLGASHR